MRNAATRRQFLKAAAAGGASAALVTMFGSNPSYAAPPVTVPQRVSASLSEVAAAALPSSLILGAPLADIAKGWDGTLWGVDINGVPYHFDPIASTWAVFGSGFDVICRWDDKSFFVTRGAEVSVNGRAAQALTDLWGNLPDSFAQGIDGAANIRGTIHLFRNGRYLAIDPVTQRAGAPVAVTSLGGWPTTNDAWRNGAVEVVGSNGTTINDSRVLLWCKNEYIWVDMVTKSIIVENPAGPHPLDFYVAGQMLEGMRQGFTTLLWDETNYSVTAFNGPVAWTTINRDGTAFAIYPSGYYRPWTPVLRHAPSGSAGALWATSKESTPFPLYHDGSRWQQAPRVSGGVLDSIAVGADNSVFALSASGLERHDPTTARWSVVAAPFSAAEQVAVGDSAHVWLRTTERGVLRLNGDNWFDPVDLGHDAVDIAAGSDGTLWHAAGDTSIYRYLSDGTKRSSALSPGVPGGATVDRVATTGFGAAYVLSAATATVYSYETPYVFTSAGAYFAGSSVSRLNQSLSVAGHTLFASTYYPTTEPDAIGQVSAVDAQTGANRWTFTLPRASASETEPSRRSSRNIYDPALDLLYVVAGTSILALNATTGEQVWRLDTFAAPLSFTVGELGSPGLASGLLVVGHSEGGKVVAIDTVAAFDRASRGQTPQPLWVATTIATAAVPTLTGAPVVDENGLLYLMTFLGPRNYQVTALDAATGTTAWTQSFGHDHAPGPDLPWDIVLGNTRTIDGSTPAVFVNAATEVMAFSPVDGSLLGAFAVPQPQDGDSLTVITSGLVYRDSRLYFGDSRGKVYVVDASTLTLITSTADSPQQNGFGVTSRPVLIAGTDPQQGIVVGFTRGEENINLFDPASGALDQVATDQSAPGVLMYDDAHGVLYAMAWAPDGGFNGQAGRLFAIRPDSYIQDERSFIIESELMQDYASDAEASGEGVSRYQTHITIVDAAKVPRANQSVKVWADEADTVVSIDGAPFTIGPETSASFTTDGTGSFTVVSDASDLATATLRLWAVFMDEHERIAVVPDAEFHRRLAASSATGDTDPQHMDMVTATSYDGKPLFTDTGQAQQASTAVTQLTSSVGMGTGVATLLNAGTGTHTSISRYITYPDLPGLAYTPVNVAAAQDVLAQNSVGFSIAGQKHTTLSPAEAADLFDSLEGTAIDQLGGFLSALSSAWREIKEKSGEVKQVVVSVAKDVLAGIQYVVDGVTKVVKAVVQDIKDAAAAIGSFFVQLGKDIAKVVQALGKLLELGEVFATAKIVRQYFDGLFPDMNELLQQGKKKLDGWFDGAEADVAAGFCSLYTTLGLPGCGQTGGGPVSGVNGMGQTSTTVYNTGSEPGTSRSVECGWSTHTLRNNLDQATTPDAQAEDAGADPFGAMAAVVTDFVTTMTQDPVLNAAYELVGRSFSATFTVSSPEQLLRAALQDLLSIFEAITITGLALSKALMDALLTASQKMVDGLQALGNVHIPILSTLWRGLTGTDLTFLDLISFVLAFPVTFIYRAVEGSFPSAEVALTADATDGLLGSSKAARTAGLIGALGMITAGVVTAAVDTLGFVTSALATAGSKAQKPFVYVGGVLLLLGVAGSVYTAFSTADNEGQMEPWTAALATTNVLGVVLVVATALARPGVRATLTLYSMMLGGLNVFFFFQKAQALNDPVLTLTREILAAVPGLVNPIKKAGLPVGLVAPAANLAFRCAAGGIQLTQTIEKWNDGGEEPPPPPTTAPPSTDPSSAPEVTTTSTTTGPAASTTVPSRSTSTPLTSSTQNSVASTTPSANPSPGQSPPGKSGSLPYTGVNVGAALLGGLGAMTVGGVALLSARRRKVRDTNADTVVNDDEATQVFADDPTVDPNTATLPKET